MQVVYGAKKYDFVPKSFNCPIENVDLQKEMISKKGTGNSFWIFKPKDSCQGKGITLISSFDEVPRGKGGVIS
jgi:hypothetical protein